MQVDALCEEKNAKELVIMYFKHDCNESSNNTIISHKTVPVRLTVIDTLECPIDFDTSMIEAPCASACVA